MRYIKLFEELDFNRTINSNWKNIMQEAMSGLVI